MDLRLKFSFNDSTYSAEFTIVNPPTVPEEGEVIGFRWRDFIADETVINKLEKYGEDGIFIANVFSRTYTRDYVTVSVYLYEEQNYEDEFERTHRSR